MEKSIGKLLSYMKNFLREGSLPSFSRFPIFFLFFVYFGRVSGGGGVVPPHYANLFLMRYQNSVIQYLVSCMYILLIRNYSLKRKHSNLYPKRIVVCLSGSFRKIELILQHFFLWQSSFAFFCLLVRRNDTSVVAK